MKPEDNHLLESIKSIFVPIHPAGWFFIAIFIFVTFLLALLWSFLGWLGLIASIWCIYFFRNPHRVTPIREGLVVSPADGVIQSINKVVPPAELELGDGERTRISIFMNVFNVHVNRIPITGSVSKIHYKAGKFLNASLDKASAENEQNLIKITTPENIEIGVVQIAGLVARRILCDLNNDQPVKTGEQFGIIRFGSRVDVYLPVEIESLAIVGQIAIGGETVLADLSSSEFSRVGTKY
ncbi:MAG: phosphatidylserine decarboxylase [Rickettsiales bacterium]|jgi:phosphatidylserine decarboxylase